MWTPSRPLCSDTLVAGEVLSPGQRLTAPGSDVTAQMRPDGNLVVCRGDDGPQLWASGTGGHPDATVVMQDDGEIVIRDAGDPHLWSSATGGHPGAFLQLHDDGTLVAYGFYRAKLWSSREGHVPSPRQP